MFNLEHALMRGKHWTRDNPGFGLHSVVPRSLASLSEDGSTRNFNVSPALQLQGRAAWSNIAAHNKAGKSPNRFAWVAMVAPPNVYSAQESDRTQQGCCTPSTRSLSNAS